MNSLVKLGMAQVAIVIMLALWIDARPQMQQGINWSNLFAPTPRPLTQFQQQQQQVQSSQRPINSRNPTISPPINPPQQASNATSSSATPTPTPTPQPSPVYWACLHSCPTTTEYNPACGSDQQDYYNPARLNCAIRCGQNVQLVRMGTCSPL